MKPINTVAIAIHSAALACLFAATTPAMSQSQVKETLAAAPATSSAISQAAQVRETLGPGDAVKVTVFQNPDFNTETRLSERGTVVFPLIGEMKFNGLTPAQAGTQIAEALKRGKYINNPQVTVQLMAVRSRQVAVLGEVARPGKYALDDNSSRLTDILAVAGGVTPAAADTVTVLVSRGDKLEKREIDVSAMARDGNLGSNLQIEGGDTIYVQRAPVFYIYGEVQRAGSYRLSNNMSVMQALSLGGGVTLRGTERGMMIHRRSGDGKVQKVEVRPTDPVQPDDVIYVKESLF
jgi:polysaccharide export outer membrane protein